MSRTLGTALAAATLTAITSLTFSPAAHADPPPAGPSYPFEDALMGEGGPPIPLKNMAMLTKTEHGYLLRAGQQDSHLTITYTHAGLRFTDTGTQRWRSVTGACTARPVRTGVKALCKVPNTVTEAAPMLIEVWPRLGDDHIDGRTLPAEFQMTVLADEGNDVIHTGHGNDFINGAQDNDKAWGGDGNDWIRTGIGDDVIHGNAGNDRLAGLEDDDVVYGDEGNDQVSGGIGDDTLYAGLGFNTLLGDAGHDTAYANLLDKVWKCEIFHLTLL